MLPHPCNCGFLGDESHPCVCSAADIVRYRSRLSGPLADRIDMHVTLGAVPLRLLNTNSPAETSATIRDRVARARAIQAVRYAAQRGIGCNAHASGRHLLARGRIEGAARELLVTAADTLRLSARAYHRVIKVGRTIADLEGSEVVTTGHVAEALQYRPRGDVHELRARLA